MPFLQLTFEVGALEPERLEAACFEAGALAVTLTDGGDTPVLEPDPGAMPLWPRVRAAVLFSAQTDSAAIRAELETALQSPLPDAEFSALEDRIWEREWLKDFQPMCFGARLWVCPQGQETPAEPDAVLLNLDPGLAFGTGTHASTALCLEWLAGAALSGKRIIDYGCGSGILSIAAVKLGARQAWAIDHDPQALLATRDNAESNEIADRVQAVAVGAELPCVEVLLANILAQPLIDLAEALQARVRPAGDIVLSGIMADQAAAVMAAYTPWFDMELWKQREEWVCLHGRRRPAA